VDEEGDVAAAGDPEDGEEPMSTGGDPDAEDGEEEEEGE